MQVFATSTSPVVTGIGVGTGASKYTDLVTQYVNTLASGSKASLDDQLNAWQNLQSLLITGDDKGSVLYQTNKNDCQRAYEAYANSDLMKKLEQLDSQFNSAGLASGIAAGNGGFNIAQNKLDNLARFSPDEQKMIFVAGGMNIPGRLVINGKSIYYASVDDWKADLKQQAAAYAAQPPAPSQMAPSAAVALTAAATGGQNTATAATPNKVAVALPPQNGESATNASIALQVLLSVQEANHAAMPATAESATKTGTSSVPNYTGPRTPAIPRTVSKAVSILPGHGSANP